MHPPKYLQQFAGAFLPVNHFSLRRLALTVIVSAFSGTLAVRAQTPPPSAPSAVVIEAEDFAPGQGWKVVQNGRGNYMVDAIGFTHISGERLLSAPANAQDARAAATMWISR